jgi:hypothetical protein
MLLNDKPQVLTQVNRAALLPLSYRLLPTLRRGQHPIMIAIQ